MFYYIKIKSSGSEFILESSDKEVTQREMDLYFAGIFDVSEEFKSSIKKIEIINQNVKSINDFEKHFDKTEPSYVSESFENNFEQQKPQEELSTVVFQNDSNEIENQTQDIYENIEAQSPEIIEEQAQNNVSDENVFQEIPNETIEYNEIISQIEAQEVVSQIEPKENQAAKKYIEENNSNIIHRPEIKEVVKDEINDYFTANATEDNQNNQQMTSYVDDIPEGANQFIQLETKKSEIDELISLAQSKLELADTTIDVGEILANANINEDADDTSNKANEEDQNIMSIDDAGKNDYRQTMLEDIFNVQKNDTQIQRQTMPENVPPLDFKPFLTSYPCETLQDEFLVCAYFIKHALKQPNFTIKFINSKLFQATGKIVDMSIIDEMVMKEYIKIMDYETPKTYCITAQGEIHFTSLQG